MDQPGFPVHWDEDRQLQLPQAGRGIDASRPDQDFRFGSQPRALANNPVASQPDATFPSQQQLFPQYLERQSHLNLSGNDRQVVLSQNPTSNSPFSRILNHPKVGTHRDSICFYLHLPPGLWTEIYRHQSSLPVYQELAAFHAQKYGRPPPDLWALIHQLREQHDFQQVQGRLVNTIAQVPQQNPPHTPGGPSAREQRSYGGETTLDQSGEPSPILFHISSPIPGQDNRQTTATTPHSVGNARSKSQSPFKRNKGRAPPGERYKCPYTNCKHDPFRNAGNFNNHMRSCHAESPYRNQDPSTFLMPDVSPQPSIQGDGTSSAATNASDSPVNYRRQSQENGSGDLTGAFSRDRFPGMGEGTYHTAVDDELQASTAQGLTSYPQEVNITSGLANTSIREDINLNLGRQHPQLNNISDSSHGDVPRFSPEEAGPVGFGDFQQLEERWWDERMKK